MTYYFEILKTVLIVLLNVNICNGEKTNDDELSQNYNNMTKTFRCSVSKGIPLPINENRGGHAGGIINNNIIVLGGTSWSKDKSMKYFLNSSLIFDNQMWKEGPALPKPIAHSMFASDNSGLYIAGGTNDGVLMSKRVFVLHSTSKESRWERLPDLPEAIGFGAATMSDGIFYVSGGTLNNGGRINKMWALKVSDLESGWYECEPMPGSERMLHTLVGCGEYLYVLGGLAETSPLTPLNDIFRYDYRNDKWEVLDDLPMKGYAWMAQPIDEFNLLITGRADGQIHSGIWVLNLETLKMEIVGDLVIPSTTAPLIKVSESEWWLVGGEPDSNKNRTREVSKIRLISK